MRLTTKGRYGVRAVTNLALAVQNRPISISQIAREEDLSPEFLEQIFFRLKKSGIIRSIRGPKGGFVLDRNPSKVSVKMILDGVGEPLYPAPCTNDTSDEPCERVNECPIAPMWTDLYRLIVKYLTNISLKDLVEQSKKNDYAGLNTGQEFSI